MSQIAMRLRILENVVFQSAMINVERDEALFTLKEKLKLGKLPEIRLYL